MSLSSDMTEQFETALANCASEPIHIPGAVQPFGILLVLNERLQVEQVAGQLEDWLGLPPAAILGRSLTDLLPASVVDRLRTELVGIEPGQPRQLGPVSTLHRLEQVFDARLHVHEGLRLLELLDPGSPPNIPTFLQVIFDLTEQLEAVADISEFAQQVVSRLQAATGYDRVMVYRFDPNWHGEVIAEARIPELEPFLGLWFPASDIPSQARDLYRRCRVRVLADATADPLPLLPRLNPTTAQEVDLSYVLLRAMSPIHREYMLNMNMRSSLVASVIREGSLWGLIACHHRRPLVPSASLRSLVEQVARLLATKLQVMAAKVRSTAVVKAQAALSALRQALTTELVAFDEELIGPRSGLMELLEATGIAFACHDQILQRGDVPPADRLARLISWLRQRHQSESLFVTDSLSQQEPEFSDLCAVASGLLAVNIPGSADWFLWFRPELPATVRWAGDPRKGLIVQDQIPRLTPRRSFAEWVEQVRGRSRPWTEAQIALVEEVIRPNLVELLLTATQSQMQQARRELDSERKFLRQVIDTVPGFVAVKDADGRFLLANKALAAAYGTSVDQLVGRMDADFCPSPEQVERFRAGDAAAIRTQATIVIPEEPFTTADGSLRYLTTTKHPFPAADGSTHVLLVCTDITERVLAERSLRHSENALRAANAQYRLLADSIQDIIFLMDLQGHVQYVSPSCERLLGYKPQEFIGKQIQSWSHPEDHFAFMQALVEGRAGRSARLEHRCRRKDGTWVWIENLISPVFDGQGKVTGIVSCSRDITLRRQVEDQLWQSQKMEAIGLLAGGIAHDFNNLLTVVSGNAFLLREKYEPTDPECELIEQIQQAADRGSKLARQMLIFSRRRPVRLQVLDLNNVVQDACRILRRLISEQIELQVVLDPQVGPIEADPVHLEQVLMNLMINAQDAMPQGGRLTVETTACELRSHEIPLGSSCSVGRFARLSVMDTGTGMPPEVLARIFEPFFTTKEPGKGTGLGLSTVYGIVKQARGFIQVDSTVGVGTVFHIYFPSCQQSLNDNISSAPVTTEAYRGTETLLVVEDDPEVRLLTVTILRQHGYSIISAENGEKALLLCNELTEAPALVLSDLVMPTLGGRELVKLLARRFPQIKAIILSGYSEEKWGLEDVAQLPITFLQKPFSVADLLKTVRRMLNSSGWMPPVTSRP